jgi:hypothetical protein
MMGILGDELAVVLAVLIVNDKAASDVGQFREAELEAYDEQHSPWLLPLSILLHYRTECHRLFSVGISKQTQ